MQLLESSAYTILIVSWRVQVGSCTFCIKSRPNGTGKPLLRLSEQSDDAEYVVVLPAAVASVLLDVLHRAVECLQEGRR
jgi:hypothetical protein